MPAISIIIPHYNDLSALNLCLDSLGPSRAEFPAAEVIVADNGSPCGIEAVRQYVGDRARVVLQEVKGAGLARNEGVAAAKGDIFAFIDSDCLAGPGWLRAGLEGLEKFDIVGGRVDVGTDTDGDRTGAEVFELAFAFRNEDYIRRKGFTVSANLFCPRYVFEQLGGFAQDVSEDVDWCHRGIRAGFRLGYVPEALVINPARRNWEQLVRKWRRLNSETMLLRAAAGSGSFSWRLRAIAVGLSAIPHTLRILRLEGLTARERMRGLATLYAIRLWRAWDALILSYPSRSDRRRD